MSDGESIYQRLAREQQTKAQRVLIWYFLPLMVLGSLIAVLTGNSNDKIVSALVLGVIALVIAVHQEWRKRRSGGR